MNDFSLRYFDLDDNHVNDVISIFHNTYGFKSIETRKSYNYKGFTEISCYATDKQMLKLIEYLRSLIFEKQITIYFEKIA